MEREEIEMMEIDFVRLRGPVGPWSLKDRPLDGLSAQLGADLELRCGRVVATSDSAEPRTVGELVRLSGDHLGLDLARAFWSDGPLVRDVLDGVGRLYSPIDLVVDERWRGLAPGPAEIWSAPRIDLATDLAPTEMDSASDADDCGSAWWSRVGGALAVRICDCWPLLDEKDEARAAATVCSTGLAFDVGVGRARAGVVERDLSHVRLERTATGAVRVMLVVKGFVATTLRGQFIEAYRDLAHVAAEWVAALRETPWAFGGTDGLMGLFDITRDVFLPDLDGTRWRDRPATPVETTKAQLNKFATSGR
jgi:hypothetical protein